MNTKTTRQRFAFMRARAEIHRDVAQGIVPKTVTSFAELHDYVDANEYGGFTDLDGAWAFDDDEAWNEQTVAEMNDVQNALDSWLRSRPFEWTTGAVDLGGEGPVWLAVWQDDNRWNGWLAAPRFDAYTAVRILDMVNEGGGETVDGEYVPNYYGYDWHFEDDGTLVVESIQNRYEDPEHNEPERIEPDEDGLYTVGAWGWVWSQTWRDRGTVEDAEKVDPVVMAFLPEGEED